MWMQQHFITWNADLFSGYWASVAHFRDTNVIKFVNLVQAVTSASKNEAQARPDYHWASSS